MSNEGVFAADVKEYMSKLEGFKDAEHVEDDAALEEAVELESNESVPGVDKQESRDTVVSNDFESYLETLGSTREKEFAREAKNLGWDHKKYETGTGKSAEVWVANQPYINALKEQQEKIKELTDLVYSNNKVTARTLSSQKETANEYYEAAQNRLADAKDAGDVGEMEAAYNDMQKIKKIIDQTDEQLSEIKLEKAQAKLDVPQERLDSIRQHAEDFVIDNYEWAHPDSPDFDKAKMVRAQEIELKILSKDPNINPKLLYKRVASELRISEESHKGEKTSVPAVRKAALESTSSVRSFDHRATRQLTDTQKVHLDALRILQKRGSNYMTPDDYLKRYGKK